VLPEMILQSITASAMGAIQPGDSLVKVENEVVSGMPLLRGLI
jgi:hypothetical protein